MSALWWMLASTGSAQDVDGFAELRVQGHAGIDSEVPLTFVERFRPSFTGFVGERVVLATTIEAGLGQGWTSQGAFADLVADADLSPALLDAYGAAEPTNTLFRISRADDGTALFVPTATLLATARVEVSLAGQLPVAPSGGGVFKPAPRDLRVDLPAADGSTARVDLDGLVPDATGIVWSRFTF